MIIQIRGTSGSGKTTVMREVMEKIQPLKPVFVNGRKRPLYYENKRRGIVVLGHYEIDCGGCDTIGSAPKVYDLLQTLKFNVALTEGLLWSEDVKWSVALQSTPIEVRVYFLITDAEECLRRVTARQAGRIPRDPERVRRKLMTRIGTIERARRRLLDSDVYCRRVGQIQAVKLILKDINSL